MAVSRRLALLSLGTILLCFLFTVAAVAASDYGDDIHTVRHSDKISADSDCISNQADKGDQCREENDIVEDDDFDDTYKIVNNVPITLSASGTKLQNEDESEETRTAEEEVGNMFILGH